MSLPGRKSHMRRLHWPPRPRVWLCPGNMCQRACLSRWARDTQALHSSVHVWKFVVSLAPDKHHCLFWVLWHTLCYGPAQSGQGQLLPLASPRVSRAPGDCGGWDRPRHHQFLLLRKHRQGLRGEGNSLGICPSASGTHRNISRSSRIDSGKNNWQNVNSKAKITITTPKPTWTL